MAARKLNNLIFVTIFNSVLSVIFIGVAIGTNHWYKATAEYPQQDTVTVHIHYGLFTGTKVTTNTGTSEDQNHKIHLVCLAGENICMFSCGWDSDKRKLDIQNLNSENRLVYSCLCEDPNLIQCQINNQIIQQQENGGSERKFVNFILLVFILLFASVAILFNLLSAALALYNTFRAPIQPILSIYGLYIWNTIAGLCVLLSIILWSILYTTVLTKNANISETLAPMPNSPLTYATLNVTIGYSFWLLIVPLVLIIASNLVLKYRSWRIIKNEEINVKVINETPDNGDILLF